MTVTPVPLSDCQWVSNFRWDSPLPKAEASESSHRCFGTFVPPAVTGPGFRVAVADLSERTTVGWWPPCGAGAGSARAHWSGVGRRRCRRGSNYSRPTPTATRDFSRRPRRGPEPGRGRAATGLRSANDRIQVKPGIKVPQMTGSRSRAGP
jgi:hypothetical protein